jgi:N-formylglutamate amidohydrolase
VPHAGRHYPAGLLAAMRQPELAARRLEDRLVDLIGLEVARATGATLLVAQAPRAMIDLNRAPDDIDREMIVPDPTVPVGRLMPRRGGAGAASGAGRRAGWGWCRAVWRGWARFGVGACRPPSFRRDRGCPRALSCGAGRRACRRGARLGAALLLDLHSMPPLPVRADGEPGGTFVLGDRFGASCATRLSGRPLRIWLRAGCGWRTTGLMRGLWARTAWAPRFGASCDAA